MKSKMIYLTVLALGLLILPGCKKLIGNVKNNTDIKITKLRIEQIEKQLDRFNADIGRYPTQEEGLTILFSKPESEEDTKKWVGPYMIESKPLDAWGQPIRYEVIDADKMKPGSKPFRLISNGLDQKPNTDDDIKSPEN